MKLLIKLFVVLVLLVAIGVTAVFFYIDKIAKAGVETGGSYALGVPTTLKSADVGVFSGEFSMRGLNVANPEGFDTDHFLNLDDAGVKVALKTLRGDTVELPSLHLISLDMNLEKKAGKSNYQMVLDNLKRLESGEKPAEDTEEEGKGFIVREIIIKDIVVHVDLLPIGGELSKVVVGLPKDEEIRLTDVGAGEGGPVKLSELFGIIYQAVLMFVIENGGDLPSEILGELQNGLAGLLPLDEMGIGVMAGMDGQFEDIKGQFDEFATKGLKGLGEDPEGAAEQIKGLGESAGDALKGLGGLLGGDKDDKDTEEGDK